MRWEDIFGKLKLVDAKIQGEQVGLIKIDSENKTYNFSINLPTPEAATAFAEGLAAPEIEKRAKEAAKKRLETVVPDPEILSESTAEELASAAIGLTALEAMPSEDIGISDMPKVKISKPSSTNPE